MDLIEEMIRKGPGRIAVKSFIRKATLKYVQAYFNNVHTHENLSKFHDFRDAWEDWSIDYQVQVKDFVDLYHIKTKGALLWVLYSKDEVSDCIQFEMLEPNLFAEGCYHYEHENVKFIW